MLIALDTSTSWGSVAVFDGRRVLAELTWRSERRSGDELFPMLERALSLANTSLADIDRIAVAIGPGSFPGIRVAISAARGLARAGGAAVAGIPTLDVMAFPHGRSGAGVCALLPAGREEWFVGYYKDGARRSPFAVRTLAAIARELTEPTLVTGEFDVDAEAEIRDVLGERADLAPPSLRVRRAGHLAELGWTALSTRQGTHIDALEPIYVKPPSVGGAARAVRDAETLTAVRGT